MPYLLYIILLLFTTGLVNAQQTRIGSAFITNYSPTDYNAGNQNWAIIQNDDGILYFGNNEGIIEFDGKNWRSIDNAYIVSSGKDKNGVIYMGGRENLGYLHSNPNGSSTFRSLKHLIHDTSYSIRYIRNIVFHEDEVWFSDENGHILKYDGTSIKVEKISDWLGLFVKEHDTIYIQTKAGLGFYKDDKIQFFNGGDFFAESSVRNIHRIGGKTLIITRLGGVYRKIKTGFTKWDTPLQELIKKSQVYVSTSYNDQLVLGTVESGVLVINKEGEQVLHMNEKSGMINHDHCSIFVDQDGNIWSGLEFGISQIHFNSPFSYFNESSGLNNSAIYSIKNHANNLYVGTARGLYISKWDNTGPRPVFKLIEGNSGRKLWDFEIINNHLISSSSNIGMYKINQNKAYKIPNSPNVNKILSSDKKNIFIGIGEHGGAYTLYFNDNQLDSIIYHDNLPILKEAMLFDNKIAWGLKHNNEIIRFKFSNNYSSITEINYLKTNNSINKNLQKSILKFQNQLFIGTDSGTYAFNNETNEIKRQKDLSGNNDLHIFRIRKDNIGLWWFVGKKSKQPIIGQLSSDLQLQNLYPISFNNLAIKENLAFYPIDSTQILIGASDRLVTYNAALQKSQNSKSKLIIRYVILNNSGDSLRIYSKPSHEKLKTLLAYGNNALTFKYSFINYDKTSSIKYSFKLEGFDKKWSTLTSKSEKEYSYLPEGEYTFKIRAYLAEKLEDERQYSFTVSPPWYRTYWAYISYFITAIIVLIAIRYYSIKKVENENIKLENEVNKRTKEIMRKNNQLEMQKEEISAQRDEISHQQKKILDSIEYAKHIQGALLPKKEVFESHFSDAFLIFKPKDIVSGDFYWLKKINNHLLFTVADCTGHGVPGAFMSIMGISFLNEIVRRKDIFSPDMVLNELNKQVKQSLSSQEIINSDENDIQKYLKSNVKDGIELALADIDLEKNILYYSGAESPVYIIRNNELIILEGTPIPIGIHYKNVPFELKQIELQKGDCIYMFTDGYRDQFGSNAKIKFSTEKFKQVLLNNHSKSLSEQKELLCKVFSDWKGENDQIDDITILGLKI
jgi:serine phosphatase RsbU (regulator of sigma subunit)/ligand-binding sensor domain-containing protein